MRVLSITTIVFLLLLSACRITNKKNINGNGTMASEQRNFSNFSGVEVSGPYDVFLTQGEDYKVRIEGDENLLEYVEVEQHGDILEVSSKDGFNLRPRNDIKVYVTAPRMEKLEIAGSGSIISESRIRGSNKMNITIAGSGHVKLAEVDAPKIRGEIGGSGSITLKGTTKTFNAEVAGSGEIHAFELLSETTNINIAGSGDAEVFASKKLDVTIAGVGDVKYRGNPAVTQSKAGAGSVRKVD